MSDLTEALALLDEALAEGMLDALADFNDGERTIIAAARRWADLEAQVAEGARVVAEHHHDGMLLGREVILGEGSGQ